MCQRGIEVGLSGAESDHVLAFGLQFGGASRYGQRGRGLDALNAS